MRGTDRPGRIAVRNILSAPLASGGDSPEGSESSLPLLETDHLNRGGRTSFLHRTPGMVGHSPYLARKISHDHRVTTLEHAMLNQNSCHRPFALIQLGFDNDTNRIPLGIGRQLQHLCLQPHGIE